MFQFPPSPAVGQEFIPTPGIVYRWNGTAWFLISSLQLDYVKKSGDTMTGGLVIAAGGLTVTGGVTLPTGNLTVSAGQVLAANGNSGAPAYAFTAQANSGLWRLDAATLGISVNGTVPLAFLAGELRFRSLNALTWSSGVDPTATLFDLALFRDGAGILAQRNGANAQAFRVYNTFTDGANFERLELVWTGNTALLRQVSAGTGVARNLQIRTEGNSSLFLGANATARWLIEPSLGHFLANADNVSDIGQSGANRPRSIYAGTSVVVAGIPLGITRVAEQALAGTAVDFTGIPAGVKRITVIFAALQISGAGRVIVQLGDSGGFENTNYFGSAAFIAGAAVGGSALYNSGYDLTGGDLAAVSTLNGQLILNLLSTTNNRWVGGSNVGYNNGAAAAYGAGFKSLSATLDRIRITTVAGVATFAGGGVATISYE